MRQLKLPMPPLARKCVSVLCIGSTVPAPVSSTEPVMYKSVLSVSVSLISTPLQPHTITRNSYGSGGGGLMRHTGSCLASVAVSSSRNMEILPCGADEVAECRVRISTGTRSMARHSLVNHRSSRSIVVVPIRSSPMPVQGVRGRESKTCERNVWRE